MENIITYSVIGLTIVPIIIGALLGWSRGWRRATLRLGLVLLSMVLAFVLRKVIGNAIASAQIIQGQTISEFLTNTLIQSVNADAGSSLYGTVFGAVDSIVKGIVYVISFLSALSILMFLTWAIVFPICKIFVKPKLVEAPAAADGKTGKPKYKKYGLIGAGIGAVQGLLVAVCCCIMLTGIVVQCNNALGVVGSLQAQGTQQGGEQSEMLNDLTAILDSYTQSSTCAFYNTNACQSIFNKTSEIKTVNEDGSVTTTTFAQKMEDLKAVGETLEQAMRFGDLDFGSLLDKNADPAVREEAQNKVKDIFDRLGEIQGNMSEEGKQMLNDFIGGVADSIGEQLGQDFPLDLKNLDFSNVDFKKEGEVFSDLVDFATNPPTEINDETKEEIKGVVDDVVKSDLVFSVLESNKDNIDLQQSFDEEQLDQLGEILDEVEQDLDPELQDKLDSLREMLGLK